MSTIEIILYSACALALIGIAASASFNIGYWTGYHRGRMKAFHDGHVTMRIVERNDPGEEIPLGLGWGDDDESEHSSFAPDPSARA